MELSTLKPNKGARKTPKRLGRGNASGTGRTAGKGEKGQKARSGGHVRPGFEGGQMPLYRRLPKFGFNSRKRVFGKNLYTTINLAVLEGFAADSVVDEQALRAGGVTIKGRCRAGIKVLGTGKLTKKLHVKVNAISKGAREKIESLGGTVELLKAPVAAQESSAK